jgi:basic membrane protein A
MASRIRSNSGATRRRLATAGAAVVLGAAVVVSLAAATVSPAFTACLVTGDGSPSLSNTPLGDLAGAGLKAAEQQGVRGRVIRSARPADDLAGLRTCVLDGAGVTIGVGYLMAGPMNEIATQFPSRKFVIVDVAVTALASRPANVQGVLFKAQEAGYVVGYAAGLWAKARGAAAVGSVGGLKIPPVDSYIAGFQAGAKRANPGVKTLNNYAQSFSDESNCSRLALSQIAHGSVVEFQVAGRCGLGVLRAAHAKHVFAIGADTGQGAGRPWVMTSAVKRVDVAVLSAILSARDGSLETGVNDLFGARRGGVGYAAWSPLVPAKIRSAVARVYERLEAGAIPGIPATLD